ncbi:MAG: hypothetical protein WC052_00920 [Patescibacteria group bacterium]
MKSKSEDAELERELARRWRENRDLAARNELVERNLWFARWSARITNMGRQLTAEEREQIAYCSLVEATIRFDERKGGNFRGYASWYILGALNSANATANTAVHYPSYLYAASKRIKAATLILEVALGRKPTRDEIMKHADVTGAAIDAASEPVLPKRGRSLDAPLMTEDGESRTLHDVMAAGAPAPETIRMAKGELVDVTLRLEQFVADVYRADARGRKALRERNASFLIDRHGIWNDDGIALEEVGKKHGVSRQMVNQTIKRLWRCLQTANAVYTEAWLENILRQKRALEILLENEQ